MRDSCRRIVLLASFNVAQRRRDPGQLIGYTVMPMVLMTFLEPLFTRAMDGGAEQVVIGQVVVFSVLTLAVVATSIVTERTWRTWDALRATPAAPLELLVGKAFPAFVLLVLQQAILLIYGARVIGLEVKGSPWLLLLAVLSWAFTLLAVGSLVGAYVRSHGELAAACDVGGLVISTVGGALVPVAMLPGWVQAVAPASPGYWALRCLQGAVRGETAAAGWAAAVLVAFGLLAGTLACRRLSRGWGRAAVL